jgi:hypothetical protein
VVPSCICPLSFHNVTPGTSSLLRLSLFYSIDMIELLLPCEFDTLQYSWVKATIDICTFADYFVAKKREGPAKAIRGGGEQVSIKISQRNLDCPKFDPTISLLTWPRPYSY